MDNEQCLVIKALGRTTGMTRLKMRVENSATSRLGESSDKALSAKHAYQAEHERRDGLSTLLFRGSGRENPRARVRSGSRRPLGSYHENHEAAGLNQLVASLEWAEIQSRH